MLNVAVLDDYQNVSKKYGNWNQLDNHINLKVFNKYIKKDNDLIRMLSDFEVLCLMRERTKLSSKIINNLPNLKLVITSGMWNPSVDLKALNKRNIVFSGTENRIQSTAELSWLLTQIVWRNIYPEFENITNGKWQTTIGRTLFGKTLGIFGLGKQGQQVARFGRAFGMKVIAWSHNLTKKICAEHKVTWVTSDNLFKMSDVFSIHTKLSDRTMEFIDINKIKLMKKSAIIINTSRGPIIKEKDLILALKKKMISGIGLDVFDVEPLPSGHIFRKLMQKYNLVLTPHLGYVSSETYEKFYNGYVLAIKAFINGNPINKLN
ncbi:D-2-hydroxyacid dehydrogenase family protein [Alphaproteobacteria bacterium]|nr:D-2-hydroxyacid dehydrogenase family protein [Alphaproteobacteria bacterium]